MSLPLRLIIAVSALLMMTLLLGGALTCWRAFASVQTEMHAAMDGGQAVSRDALNRHQGETQSGETNPAFVSDLVFSFNGQRHIQATVVRPDGAIWAQSSLVGSHDRAPAWFRHLIDVPPRIQKLALPAPRGALLLLRTDPMNEITEVWQQTCDAFATLLLFCGGACMLIVLIVRHSLRHFSKLDAAFQAIVQGHHDTVLEVRQGPPEFTQLAKGFNYMAASIYDSHRRNRTLQAQLHTVQEEERAEIARNLHDEVGPYLFAIHVDAGNIPRLLQRGERAQAHERAAAIRAAATHIQKHIRAILRQLRPHMALEFGLPTAIGDLVAFWRTRSPGTVFTVACDAGDTSRDRRIEDVGYRLIQESISNAVRHGQPHTIAIEITRLADSHLRITVTDDGTGLPAKKASNGFGLTGMAERVRGVQGYFAIEGQSDTGGVRMVALLPLSTEAPLLATVA